MTLDWRRIDYAHWQMRRGVLGGALFGHLDPLQAIEAIALTERGACPLHYDKCVSLLQWVDRRETIARPNVARELWDAVTTYEPRVVMTGAIEFRASDYCRWIARLPVRLAGDIDQRIRFVDLAIGRV